MFSLEIVVNSTRNVEYIITRTKLKSPRKYQVYKLCVMIIQPINPDKESITNKHQGCLSSSAQIDLCMEERAALGSTINKSSQ